MLFFCQLLLNFQGAQALIQVRSLSYYIVTYWFLYKRKEVPAGTSFTTNHIHIFEGSPVNKIFKIGVQTPFQVQHSLDFQAFQTKVRILGKLQHIVASLFLQFHQKMFMQRTFHLFEITSLRTLEFRQLQLHLPWYFRGQ